VSTRQQKHVVLILARAFASNLATPTLIADDQGRLVFYNEAAEAVVGHRFSETGELPLDEWTTRFSPRTSEDEPLPAEQRAPHIALEQRRAAQQHYRVTSADGVVREITVAAFPLFAREDELVGIVVMFWRD
jgi:PAS domain-containing protein